MLLALATVDAPAAVRNWTNVLGGNWFVSGNWSPNGVPVGSDTANITASGTYTVLIATGAVSVANLNLGGASGTQTLINGTANNLFITNSGVVSANGILTITNGGLQGSIAIQPAGQLQFDGATGKNIYSLTLLNQGTVLWTVGNLDAGSTPGTTISNGGLWQITGDYQIAQVYGGPAISWLNSGILQKSAGSGISYVNDFKLLNASSGLIQVDVGTLQLPTGYTNTDGTLRLNGGTMRTGGTLYLSGGTMDGTGTVGANSFVGGTLSPGQAGAGQIEFQSGLNLNAGTTVSFSGTGLIPGSQYDQLSVTGAVTLANATLQVGSLPSVPAGTTFVLIQNDGVDAVSGTFNGLSENAVVNANGQPFRIHYSGGTGNDVTLVRDSGAGSPQLAKGGYTNGVFTLTGTGANSVIYTVQASTNLIQWINVGFATGGLSGNFLFNDPNASQFRCRFYRTTN